MGLRRPFVLVIMDSIDSMRPPGFDIMMLVIAALGAIMATIQPASQSYILARLVLEPTLFTVALYLGLRGASGLASLVKQQIIEVYMSYPVSRLGVITSILLSRVLIPAAMLLALPIIISGILLYPVVFKDPISYVLVFSGYYVQAILYGVVFLLIAIVSRSSGTASVLSITFYFAYNIIWLLIQSLSSSLGAWAEHMAIAMKFYRVTYFMALQHVGLRTMDITLVEYLFVPAIIGASTLSLVLYFTRRFEPT